MNVVPIHSIGFRCNDTKATTVLRTASCKKRLLTVKTNPWDLGDPFYVHTYIAGRRQEGTNVKTLTLHQPHATLFAIGVRFIETRSWSTKYRGPLAIHAGRTVADVRTGGYHVDFGSPDDLGSYELVGDGAVYSMPRGAIVATCELVDVVPIVHCTEDPPEGVDVWIQVTPFSVLHLCDLSSRTWGVSNYWKDVSGQIPYGDFTPGRFAWILDDIRPLSVPIPAKGKQGLWELEMEVA